MGGQDKTELSVTELLNLHAASIQQLVADLNDPEVSADCGTLLPEPYRVVYDALWCLRFILSHPGGGPAALNAARKALAWRRANSEVLQAALEQTPPPLPPSISRYLVASVHKGTKTGDPLYIVRTGLSNTPALMREVPPEQLLLWLMYQREQVFLVCDRNTRETGRMSRMITVNDMNHLSLNMIDARFMAVLKDSSKQAEVLYPQMLRTSVILNMPPVIRAVSRGLMTVVPARVRARVKVCKGSTTTGDISLCPFARQWLVPSLVPTFLGGDCVCHEQGGCICGVANDQHEVNLQADRQGLCHATVGPRSSHEVFLQAAAGCRVSYSYEVERGMLNGHGSLAFSVTLRPDDEQCDAAVEVVDLGHEHNGAAGKDATVAAKAVAAQVAAAHGGHRHRDGSADVVLVAPTKTRSDEGRVSGEVDIPLSGMVVVRWANKGATLLSRGVKCSVELLPPLTKDMDATKDLGAADANAVAVSHEQ